MINARNTEINCVIARWYIIRLKEILKIINDDSTYFDLNFTRDEYIKFMKTIAKEGLELIDSFGDDEELTKYELKLIIGENKSQ